jgi:predicted enzyme related to lactoylglutathione lyase
VAQAKRKALTEWSVMDFLHVGMKVHDIERSAHFYAAAFGIVLAAARRSQQVAVASSTVAITTS